MATNTFKNRHNEVYTMQSDNQGGGMAKMLEHDIPGRSFKRKLNSRITDSQVQ